MLHFAWRILIHDTLRLVAAMAGVAIVVVLAVIQIGMYNGFMQNASQIVDHTEVDLWVMARKTVNFDFAPRISVRNRETILAVPGVSWAEPLVVVFALWKLPDGGGESVQIIGYDPREGTGAPWNLVTGVPERLTEEGAIILDQAELGKLGLTHLGESGEIMDRRFEVIGFARGIRSFTASPYIFTSRENAYRFSRMPPDTASYIMVRVEPGADIDRVKEGITARHPFLECRTSSEFSSQTRTYWATATGAGVGFFVAALLGLIVGTAVVAQITYSSTVEHLPEFGTLKAIGADNRQVIQVILGQALLAALLGYVVGLPGIALARALIRESNISVVIPPSLLLGMLGLTILMCLVASAFSIVKVSLLDPAEVFKA